MHPRAGRQRPWRDTAHRGGDRLDMVRRRAAAAAEDVDEAAGREIAKQRRGFLRMFVVLAKRVRKTRVWIRTDVAFGQPRELGKIRPHVARAEGAVDPNRERFRVAD